MCATYPNLLDVREIGKVEIRTTYRTSDLRITSATPYHLACYMLEENSEQGRLRLTYQGGCCCDD